MVTSSSGLLLVVQYCGWLAEASLYLNLHAGCNDASRADSSPWMVWMESVEGEAIFGMIVAGAGLIYYFVNNYVYTSLLFCTVSGLLLYYQRAPFFHSNPYYLCFSFVIDPYSFPSSSIPPSSISSVPPVFFFLCLLRLFLRPSPCPPLRLPLLLVLFLSFSSESVAAGLRLSTCAR